LDADRPLALNCGVKCRRIIDDNYTSSVYSSMDKDDNAEGPRETRERMCPLGEWSLDYSEHLERRREQMCQFRRLRVTTYSTQQGALGRSSQLSLNCNRYVLTPQVRSGYVTHDHAKWEVVMVWSIPI
jgi:hypothetical protein